MRKFNIKNYRKNVGGSILFQVLLGLGLMVVMSPIVLQQIRKYNEEVRREDVISDMSKLQKAVSSFVVFSKGGANIPNGVTCWKDVTTNCISKTIKVNNKDLPVQTKKMKDALNDYLKEGSLNTEKINAYGLEYYFITIKNGADLSSILVASCVEKACIDRITLNGVGQYLFDKGSIIQDDKELLGDVKLSTALQDVMKNVVDDTGAGAIFLYTTDEMVTSDFLYRYLMPGASDKARILNTMLVNLNMNNNDINNVKDLKSSSFNVANLSKISAMVIDNAKFNFANVNVDNFIEYSGISDENLKVANGIFPFVAKKESEAGNIYMQDLDTKGGTTEFKGIDLKDADLTVTEEIAIEKDANIDLTTFIVKDDNKAKVVSIDKAIVDIVNVTQVEKTETKLGSVFMKDDKTKDAFIYVLSEQNPVVVNLSGTTEVDDIVINGEKLSEKIGDTVTLMKDTLSEYIRLKTASEEDSVPIGVGG